MVSTNPAKCLDLKQISVVLNHHRVLRSVSFSVNKKEIVSIIGPNGAGKTTLFNVIMGRIRPADGAVIYDDQEITRWPTHRICHAGIAQTFQIAKPFPEMTTLENVLIGLWFGKKDRSGIKESRERAEALLETVGLLHKTGIPAKELTLSEQRRLEVARALSTNPKLLLLDEIAAGLSPQAVNQAVELIITLRERGLTLLVIDHFLNLTARVSDRLVALDQGEVLVEGKPSVVIQHPEVISAYLGERQSQMNG